MKKTVKYIFILFIFFILVSTAVLVPATNKAELSPNLEKNKFIQLRQINTSHKTIQQNFLSQFLQKSISQFQNNDTTIWKRINTIHIDGLTEKISSFFDLNLTAMFALIVVLWTFIWAFTIGVVAVGFPQFLPIFVKYTEITIAGILSGVLTDILLVLFQDSQEMINQIIDSIINDPSISTMIKDIVSSTINITKLPGMRGGIASLMGIAVSLSFLKMWDIYKILQYIGGGLFVSIPITVPVIIYIYFIDLLIENTRQNMHIIKSVS